MTSTNKLKSKRQSWGAFEGINRAVKRLSTRVSRRRLNHIVVGARGLLAVLFCLGLSIHASATTFTETVPNGNGPIPVTYPPVGGTMFVLVGANGNIYYQFVNPSTQFRGFQLTGTPAAFRGAPKFQLGPTQALNCGPTACVDYFGGSIVEGYSRLTVRDADGCDASVGSSGTNNDFDYQDVFFEVNGIRVTSLSDLPANSVERTNFAGTTTIGTENCFRNQGSTETSTSWFDLTPIPGLLNNILSTGGTTPFIHDDDGWTNDRGDNFWYFTDGDDATGSPEVAPGVKITKTANKSSYAVVGEIIAYSFLVENIGSVTLTNVVVTDPFITGTISCPKTTLVSAESMTCTANHTVTQANLDNDVVFVNEATVTATPTEGTLGAVSGTVTIPGPPADNSMTITKVASQTTNAAAGDVITYTYVIQNTGNITLDSVGVSDTHSGAGTLSPITPASVTLAPDASQTFTATYTVTQADLDLGVPITNTATGNATPRRGTIVEPTAVEQVDLTAPTPEATFSKLASPDADLAVGDTVTYTYTVQNTGNVGLNNVNVSDSHGGTGSLSAITPANIATIAPGDSGTFTATYVITQADYDTGTPVANTATADATPAQGTYTPETADETVGMGTPTPEITFAKTASSTTNAAAGDVIVYTYTAQNTGDVALTNVQVSDNHQGAGTLTAITPASVASLPVGQTATFTANYTVVQADIDAGVPITNTATVTGDPVRGPPLPPTTDDEAVAPAAPAPALTMVKTALNTDFAAVGDTIDYEYVVTNSGNVSVSNISVTDDKIPGAGLSCPAGTIAPTESLTCTGTYTVVQADLDAGSVTNNASATGTPTGGTITPATATETVDGTQSPELKLTKTALDTDFAAVGDTLDYTYLVENIGNVEITSLVVTDDMISSVTCPATTIAAGATVTCTATYTVDQDDLDVGFVTNLASVDGAPAGGTLAPAMDDATVNGTQTAGLTIDKSALDTSFTALGDTVNYEYLVTNSGNTTITNSITVSDDKALPPAVVSCPALPAGGLLPNDDITCTFAYSITQADLDAGTVTNTASASDGTTTSPTDQATVTGVQTPEMTLAKEPVETAYSAVGDILNYTYTVTNTGNVLIANLSVTDDLIASVTCNVPAIGNNDANLDPTEVVVCTGLYTVTQADLDNGSVTNNASATGTPPGGTLTPPTDDATVDADQLPELTMAKAAIETSFDTVGDVLTYEYTVENTGNVLVSALSVSDDKITSVTCDVPAIGNNDANLDPTETVICTASYTVTQADLDAGEVMNNAAATGTPAGGTLADALADETVDANQTPAIETVKTATSVNFENPGDITTYDYVVTNTGNVTITAPISVNDNLISNVTCPALPAGGLAPTASLTCTASYVVTQADLDNGSVTNLASATDGTTTSPQTSETIPADQDPALSIAKTALFSDFTTAGEVVQYEFTVTNTGNLTLTGGINVVDDKIGTISCVPGNLAPGASQTCTAPYTITQADVDAGSVMNQAFADNGGLTSTPVDVTVTGSQTPSLGFDKRGLTANFDSVGDVLSYEFDVENTGNVTVTNISVTDNLVGAVSCPQTSLLPNASMVCTASYTVDQDDIDNGSVLNSASAEGNDPSGGPINSDPDSVTTDSVSNPSITFAKRAVTSTFANAGDIISFAFDVENDGNVTVNNITITDSIIASVNCPLTTLAPAQTMTCTANYTVDQDDVNNGSVVNTATASGDPADGSTLPDETSSVTVDGDQSPELRVTKTANQSDYDMVGDVLTYSYLVENVGNVSISAITVADDKIPSLSCTATSLIPAASFTCTGSYTVTQADIDDGSVTNIVSTTGTPAGGTLPPANDQATVGADITPGLETVKTASTSNFDSVGDAVDYTYVVTNTGNQTITAPISVSDDKIPSVSCPALPSGGLSPNASITCSGTYNVTQADIDAGSVTNLAIATDGTTTSPNATETVDGVQTPSISMTKTAAPQIFTTLGETVSYSYVITNTGNVTITSALTISDDRIATVNCPALPAGGLAPNAMLTCTATDTVTQDDLDSGSITNTASATDGSVTSPPATETVTADQMPELEMVKNALTADYDMAGDTVDYEYLVTNTGNVTITSAITVSDDKIPTINCPTLPGGELAPTATLTCVGTYTVTQADIDAGSITNIASATDGTTTSPDATETVDAVQAPELSIVKSALTSSFDAPGDVLTYEYEVRNTGNVTLTGNIMVSDDRISTVTCPNLPMAGLAPNGTIVCDATYVVTQADIDTGLVTNIASATNGTTTSPTDTATVDADQAPELSILKRALETTYDMPGDTIAYEYDVTNSGNTTITNTISVSDDKISSVSCPGLPTGGLTPMATMTCTATYTVTQADIDNGQIDNTASATDGTTTSDPVTRSVFATRTSDIEIEKNAVSVNFNVPGDITTYEYIVTNAGNVTITDPITVNDNRIPAGNISCPALPAGGLAPTASITCSGAYAATQDDLDVGSVTNVAGATDGTTTSSLTSETIPATQNPAIEMRKTSADVNFNAVGDILTYTFEIENTGNITLTGDTEIVDNKIGRFVCFSGNLTSVAPGNIQTCQETYVVTQADIDAGDVTNDAYAENSRASSPPDFVTIPAVQNPELSLVKTALTADYAAVGDTLDYTFEVTNTGNTTITFPIEVNDSRIANVMCPALPTGGLAPNTSLTCTGTDTVSQSDIDAGTVTNTASATDGFTTSDPQTETVDAVQTPSLALTKIAEANDFANVGDVLNYDYVVLNDGNVTITAAISISDDQIGTINCPALPAGGLAPNQTLLCEASDTVTQDDLDAGFVTNVATATDGTTTSPPEDVTITGTQSPELTTVKTPRETSFDIPGDTITYDYLVSNTGNVTITSPISVSDDKIVAPNAVSCPALTGGELAPDASITCEATYTVTQADVDAGFVTNIASATDGTTTSPPVDATVNGEQTSAMTVVKTAETTDFAEVGDVLTYNFVVTNTGNVTITSAISINDNRIPNVTCDALPAGGLLPQGTLNCAGTDTVSQDDLDAGTVTNTASATDGTTTSPPVDETVGGTQTAGITVDKVAQSNDFTAVGDILAYNFVIRNTGNVTLTDPATIQDDKIGTINCPAYMGGGLLPGGTHTCSANYTVTQADLDAGDVVNIASATIGDETSPTDTATVTGTQAPVLTIAKSTEAAEFSTVGEIVTYSYLVTNSGNVTVTDAITVSDDKIDAVNCPALPTGGLTPTQTLTCSADYSVTQADLDAGVITNIATASDGTTTSDPDTVSVDAAVSNSLAIEKRAVTSGFSMPGDIVSYEYDVTNTGNTTLTDLVTVADDKIDDVTCPALPSGGLAPQAVLTCSADYAVTQADIDEGSVTNIASATAGDVTSPPTEATVDAESLPLLTVTKAVIDTVQVGGPIFDVTYQIVMTNEGNTTLNNVLLEDDLATALAPATLYATPATQITGFTNGTMNASYDGAGDIDILEAGTSLPVGDAGIVTIIARIDITTGGPAAGNTAYGNADELTENVPSNDPAITPDNGDDTNPTPLSLIDTDGDGSPDNFESSTEDRDGDGIPDSEDYDPTGYFYCEENGQILSGGGITVTGPAGSNSSVGTANNIVIVEDGSNGFFQFYVTAPGRYTMEPTYPDSGVPSIARPVQNIALDATSLLPSNPALLGSSEVGTSGVIADFTAEANTPYYFTFDFEAGDPAIMMNNIPLRHCGTPGLTLSKSVSSEPIVLEDGRQRLTYSLTAENTGQTLIENLQISDDLGAVYGANRVDVQESLLKQSPTNFNDQESLTYNGVTDINTLTGVGSLNPGESVNIEVDVIVNPATSGEFTNTAQLSATAPLDGAPIEGTASAVAILAPASDATLLQVTKTAQPRTVQIGDPILYNIEITNEGGSTQTDLNIVDRLPEGFAYVPGSAVVTDASTTLSFEPNVTSRGVISWPIDLNQPAPLDSLQAGESLSVTLQVLAGPNVEFGAHENQAYVDSPRTGTRSDTGTAIVDYIPEPSFDCTPIIGRVYDDVNHNGYPDDGEPGLPAVRLVTVNGDIITTDEYGRYHIPCAVIANSERGSNFLLKADTRTLPLGYSPTTENPRVIRATRGKFAKMNFGAAHRPKLRVDLFAADFGDELGMMTQAAASRMQDILSAAPTTERAILVYHADDLESVDISQDRLALALKVVRELAPKQFKDVALEASWGDADVFDREDARGDARSVGQYYDNNPEDPNRDRVAFFENGEGDIEQGDYDRYDGDLEDRTQDETGDRYLGRQAGLRGQNGGEALVTDTRNRPSFLGRQDTGETESARPGRLRRWIGWGNTMSSYAEGLEIETTTDSLDPVKRLNATANVVAMPEGRMIRAKGYTNYEAFTERKELRIFDALRSVRGEPIAVAALTNGEAALNVTDTMPVRLQYVLRAYDANGNFDETAPKALRLGDPEFDLNETEWLNEADTAFGQNTLIKSGITVRGGAVRVYGRNVPGESVLVSGQEITIDSQGQFISEQLMPAGTQTVEIIIDGIDDTQKRIVRTVDVKSRGVFFVGQIEATIGQSISTDASGDRDFQEGRLAFYVRSRLSDRWSVTATADTGEADLGNLLNGLDDKDIGQLLRRLDPDRYYPVYGDDSTIEQDAPTSGRVYARVERDDDYVLWGNYQTSFGDTEYARVQRTLYGAKFHWDENGRQTKFGDDRTRLTGFIAEGGSRQGRDELRGTGGSVYYLRHGDISIGSEILRVETRDSVSGLVLESRRLNYGTDYDLDFIQGRIILNQPLGSTGNDGRLFRDGSQSGNDQTLVVDYEFTPVFGASDDAAVYGVRGSRWFGNHFKLGATYNHDTDGGAESDLYEADLTFQLHAGTYIKGEIAKSEGQGVETFRSIDGGFTYNPRARGGQTAATGGDAMAYALEAAVDFSEISDLTGSSYAYWRKREAGFAGYAEATNTTVEQFGGGFDLALTDAVSFSARADVSDDQTIGTNSFAEARVNAKIGEAVTGSIGISYNDDALGNSGTSVGARAEYAFSDDSNVYAFGQVGLQGENTRTTDRLGVGAEVRLSKKFLAGSEVSTGEDGLGVRASVRYERKDGDEYYAAYDLPLNSQAAGNSGTFNLGARRRYGDALSVYGEERFQFNETGLNGITHAYGVDYKPGNWNLGLSGEVGRVDELDRVAISASAGFSDERMSAGITGEWREDMNDLTGDTRKTWLLRTTARYQATEELRVQGKLNMAFSDQDNALGPQDFGQAEFTEASLAAAYRPIWDDRFNLLAKYVFLEDLSPTSQRFNGETLNYRQKSNIISVDGSYDVSPRWTLGGKYAHRSGSVTSNRTDLNFTKSQADLGVIRLDYHATSRWDAVLEGRHLDIGNGVITRTGGLAGVYRHLNDNAKLGVGVTWGGIEEQYLAAQEAEDLGWYINMIGKF